MRTDVTIALAWLVATQGCAGDQTPPPPPPPPPPPAPGLGLEDLGTFTVPVYLTAPPADQNRVFVVEKGGTIQVVSLADRRQTRFLDLRSEVSNGSEQGLLGLAFHPDYATNGLFVVDYTDVDGDSRIVQYQVSAADPDRADPATASLLLTVEQPFANHNGGMVLFGPDRRLYIGFGDGGGAGDPLGNGQRLTTLLGKVLRVDLTNGQITAPADNPFVGQANARPEIWSFGLRNPWRFSFDRATGDLYLADVGQNQREEIDVVTAADGRARGANLGWNRMEGTACFNASSCDQSGLVLPVLDYTHADGCSVTGGYVYRGSVTSLVGLYFYSDYCAGWVKSFRYSNGMATELRTWDQLAPGGQVTSFGEDAAGELYLMTSGGRVARIVEAP